MPPLEKGMRSLLERTVREARSTADAAAAAVLAHLGVGDGKPPAYLSAGERELRRRLRAHGRALGDWRDARTAQQETCALADEIAYQHWHRMLFARFLAENGLLMYPDPECPVPVTLEECAELARDEGARNGWEVAARFASCMLPQIFRTGSPVFELGLPPEHQAALERLLVELPSAVFSASDSLGWVYQYWQAGRKVAVNAAQSRIGARELPAVTQLFTEPYMVAFLLDNSLGAWWVGMLSGMRQGGKAPELRPGARAMLRRARLEEELREFFGLPGVPLEYLRFVRSEPGAPGQTSGGEGAETDCSLASWVPAAGWFDAWPQTLAELKILDPCCGSGHFLVAALRMLVPMRMELEGLTATEAVEAVLRDNLHGVEIDGRCVELAAFALALAAWCFPGEDGRPLGYRPLPPMNLAWCGQPVSTGKEEWLRLADRAAREVAEARGTYREDDRRGGAQEAQRLLNGMEDLYELFSRAPLLGSLIDPRGGGDHLFSADYELLAGLLGEALGLKSGGEEERELEVAAQGLARAAELLADRYHLVVTNVPYLARGKQVEPLKEFCAAHYPEAQHDLATVFLERCLRFCVDSDGTPGAGESGSIGYRGTVSLVLPQNWLFLTSYRRLRERLLGGDQWHVLARLGEGGFDSPQAAGAFSIMLVMSRGRLGNGGLVAGLDVSSCRTAAEKAAHLQTAEPLLVEQEAQLRNPDARIVFHKLDKTRLLKDYTVSPQGVKTGDDERWTKEHWEIPAITGGWQCYQSTVDSTVHYGGRNLVVDWSTEGKGMPCRRPLNQAVSRWGVAISEMRALPATIYGGERYDSNVGPVVPHDSRILPAIWCLCSSPEYQQAVRRIDQTLKVTNATLVKVPFDLERWTAEARQRYPHGLPRPYSDDPTQWIFHGHPCGSVVWDEERKWTAIAPPRVDATVLQVAVARLLGHRWPAELDAGMELAAEARHWVRRCGELLPLADADGIVCIPPVRGELGASDRLLRLLVAAYGDYWNEVLLGQLLAACDYAGGNLEGWLRNKFFTQHCRLFHQRPFIWHIWDGRPDGFSALVNYHKLNRKNLEGLIYAYLGDWIKRQQAEREHGVDGAQDRLEAAAKLKRALELVLEGEQPYDIFVRWKPLWQQPIGWEPDINDGVRLNIRPFMSVPDVGKKGAGVLRDRPNIKWDKDRGKDAESSPWFHLFAGERINDHHLSLAEKRAARRKRGGDG